MHGRSVVGTPWSASRSRAVQLCIIRPGHVALRYQVQHDTVRATKANIGSVHMSYSPNCMSAQVQANDVCLTVRQKAVNGCEQKPSNG
jgi:hypothetical protein